MKSRVLVLWMLAAVAAVALLAYWDEEREQAASLRELSDEQALLAEALSRALAERLAVAERDALEAARDVVAGAEAEGAGDVRVARSSGASRVRAQVDDAGAFRFPLAGRDDERVATIPLVRLLGPLRAIERPGVIHVLVRAPSAGAAARAWVAAADGARVEVPALDGDTVVKVSPSTRSVRFTRPEAAALGLPARMALGGVARVEAGSLGAWEVAVVATAATTRDRQRRAQWRLLLGVAVAGVLVLAFGSAALRRQKRGLELAHALAITALERERDERLVQADKLATMAALATGIAHEVATPLGVIVARAEQVLGRSGGDERTRRAAEIIAEQADRIEGTVRGFLALARGHTPRLEEVDPRGMARAALDLVEHRFTKAGVVLDAELAADLARPACDARMFEQVLVNLLLNACEACKAGDHVALRVERAGDRVAFVVEDDGAGIDPEAARRATEPFFTTKREGTGLGLAIASEIVHHHGGTLALAPREPRGTRAVVMLPIATRPS
ncbi:MAG: Sensor protein of zinc sigma-54-dependent two-component system [Labilithrix sp.]|nr:Sensor protein of zinc sigma-54-dependent two-component system [Labilithrix sp.]